jgi:hypothetical protein
MMSNDKGERVKKMAVDVIDHLMNELRMEGENFQKLITQDTGDQANAIRKQIAGSSIRLAQLGLCLKSFFLTAGESLAVEIYALTGEDMVAYMNKEAAGIHKSFADYRQSALIKNGFPELAEDSAETNAPGGSGMN